MNPPWWGSVAASNECVSRNWVPEVRVLNHKHQAENELEMVWLV